MKTFGIIGNPNCGKSTLFNSLTGANAHVGNWPGVTVEKKEGICKKGDQKVKLVDLPGVYSLSPYTPEEIITRNYILNEKPDALINIIDASNLERSLYLTSLLQETGVPIVIALNMLDEAANRGIKINASELSKALNLPVIEVWALKRKGNLPLINAAIAQSETKHQAKTILNEPNAVQFIDDVSQQLQAHSVENSLFHAIKILEKDELYDKELSFIKEKAALSAQQIKLIGEDYEAKIADLRYKYITQNWVNDRTSKKEESKNTMSKSERIDRVLTHKVWGIPLFIAILFAIFHITFSENFLFLGGLLGEDFLPFSGTAFEGVLGEGAINSPGVILASLLEVFSEWTINLFAQLLGGAPQWVSGLVTGGVLSGVMAVLSFLPQILLLFLFFSILEDSGYMARAAFILDRIFRRFGLSGRAFMPMIMGFGCSVPAMINTRSLPDENERTATIRVIPFFSCGAKLPILTAVIGAISLQFGVPFVDLITLGMYLLGIVTAFVAVLIMRNTTLKGNASPFVMELPPYHMPQPLNLTLHLWDKLKHFVTKAFTIILASTIVIWFISHFSFNWQFLPDERINESILANIGMLLTPIFTPMGFGSQLNQYGWVFIVAAITGLIAKENVVATFGTLAACLSIIAGGATELESVSVLVAATGITLPALIAFIAFNMLTIPCFAALATAKAELSKKKFATTVLFWIATSYLVSTVIYVVGSWWWMLFIFIALIAATVLIVSLKNKRRQKQLCKL